MNASNAVSTTFRCMSCSFGTHDQTTYAEHIKDCSSDSTSEPLSVTSDDKTEQNNVSATSKTGRTHVCKECLLPMGCSRALLLHLRDVHEKEFRIFVCKYCTSYASRYRGDVCKHARSKHSVGIYRGRLYNELHKKSVKQEPSATDETNTDKACISKVQAAPCDQNEISVPSTELWQSTCMSSRTIGLQFLGKQHPDIGDGFLCRLCSFSHAVSLFVVEHIWKDHRDKFSDAATGQVTGDVNAANVLYKCDDCSYTTQSKARFYDHCSRHQFEGPSKCPRCSYSASVSGITCHVQKHHADQESKDLSVTAQPPRGVCSKVSAANKATKRRGKRRSRKVLVQRRGQKKWYVCPYCSFKSLWPSSIYRHKLSKVCRTKLSADNKSTVKQADTSDLVEIDSSCDKAEQKHPHDNRSLSDATSTSLKQKTFTCDICSAKVGSLKFLHVHKQAHLDLRQYKCSACGLRSNYMSHMRKHTRKVHNNTKAKVVKLSLEDAKKTVEAYRKQACTGAADPGKSKAVLSSKSASTKLHLRLEVNKAGRTRSSPGSMSTSQKVKVKPADTGGVVEGNPSGDLTGKQTADNNSSLSDASSTSLKQHVFKCDICLTKIKSQRAFSVHRQAHLDLRCYQCSLCGIRSNYLANMYQHAKKIHRGQKARVIKLSAEDAKQTIETYKKHSGNFSCRLAKRALSTAVIRRKLLQSAIRGKYKGVPKSSSNPSKLRVQSEVDKASRTRSSPGSSQRVTQADALGISRSCDVTGQRKPDDTSAASTSLNQDVFTCDICSAKFKSQHYFYKHRQAHLDLRCYQCSVCGLRNNYCDNISRHINKAHSDRNAHVVRLSLEDAKQTIETYKKQFLKLSPKQETCIDGHSGTTPTKRSKAMAVQNSTSSTSGHTLLTNSSQDNLVQSKQPIMVNSDARNSHLGAGVPRQKKYYVCSVCEMRTDHMSSMHRHLRTVHRGSHARAIIRTQKLSVQKSKLALRRKSAENQKLNAEAPGSCSKMNVEKKRPRSADNDSSSVSELVTVRSEMLHMSGNDDDFLRQPVPIKSRKHYSCDICPYKSYDQNALVAHRKLHVKRSGYSYACDICPYFVCQASHLERHMQLHAKHSDEKAHENSDLKANLHLCECCPYMSVRRCALIYHKQLHRPRASALHKCEKCAFWVAEPRHLTLHAKVHTKEYRQKRMAYCQLRQISDSQGIDGMEVASALSMSDNATEELGGLPVRRAITDTDVPNELSPHKSASARDESAVVDESVVAASGENADVSVQSTSVVASRHLPTWCCVRCPYASSKLASFKRHVWLHGKHYPYECSYCDYSVQSYWQLVSHVQWHFAPNKHLVYAQSVSNLDSLPSQLPNRDSIPESLASIDRFIPSFENSDVFLLSDAPNFQCDHCPFVTEQRSAFFSHRLCHGVQSAAYRCPYCNFGTHLRDTLSAHIPLHFNLPGCRHSFVPPNVCQSQDWKELRVAIETHAERNTRNTELSGDYNSWSSYGHVESASALKDDSLAAENQAERPSDCAGDLPVETSVCSSSTVNIDHTYTLSSAPQSVMSDSNSIAVDRQYTSVTHSSVTGDNSLGEKPLLTESASSVLPSNAKFCRFCDRAIDDPASLATHEAGHLIGSRHLLP